MPTTRKRVTRGRTTLSLDSFDVADLLKFIAGWHPPHTQFAMRRSRWLTWQQYLGDWLAVRSEALQTELFQKGENFAERVYQCFGVHGPPAGDSAEAVEAALEKAQDQAAAALLRDVSVQEQPLAPRSAHPGT